MCLPGSIPEAPDCQWWRQCGSIRTTSWRGGVASRADADRGELVGTVAGSGVGMLNLNGSLTKAGVKFSDTYGAKTSTTRSL